MWEGIRNKKFNGRSLLEAHIISLYHLAIFRLGMASEFAVEKCTLNRLT